MVPRLRELAYREQRQVKHPWKSLFARVFRNPKEKFYLFKLPVPRLDDVDDAGVGVENDEGGEVEGAHGRVDDVARVLVVLALRLVGAVPVRV